MKELVCDLIDLLARAGEYPSDDDIREAMERLAVINRGFENGDQRLTPCFRVGQNLRMALASPDRGKKRKQLVDSAKSILYELRADLS